jgi:hypothetical protein
MAAGAPQTFRIPLLLLTVVNLAILGTILWPWQQAANLPAGGTSAIDPAVTLLAYLGLIYWMSSGIQEESRRALFNGAIVGVLAGVDLVAGVVLDRHGVTQPAYLQPGLLGMAVILWGIAGMRGSRRSGNAGLGALAGVWSAMTSGLMGSTAVLAELYLAGPTTTSADPWKQYQGLAIGDTVTQGLVHSLAMATGFLLLGPLVGAIVGLIFAYFSGTQKG